jgi:hypothetical protein
MGESIIQRSFAAGELAPVLHSRADQAKYQTGLRTCRNFLVHREGGVSNRAGLKFVAAAKTTTAGTRLMRYVGSDGIGFAIEMGQGYFRFFKNGAAIAVAGVPAWSSATAYIPGDLVVQAGVNYYCHTANTNQVPPNASFWHALTGAIYEIPTPYLITALPNWNQSGNVITLTHLTQQPRELVFEGTTRWVLRTVSTAPTIAAPTGLTGTAGAAGTLTYKYVVTTAAADTYEESNPTGAVTIANAAEPTPTAPNVLNWNAVTGAAEYYVYCDPYNNGVFGFVGTASSNSFRDTGFVPDFDVTPPVARVLFQSSNEFPTTAAQYQQRRFFANTNNEPDAIFGSRIGFRSNFGISSPLQDDDSITFRLAGNNHHAIRHLVALKAGLILLTDGGEWTVTGGGGPKTPITPSSINADQETYVGISSVRAAVVGNAILYVQARGSVVRELRFDQQVEGLAGRDLTIFATHLFRRVTVVSLDYQQVPDSIIWCVRSDGVLLGLTYVPDQEIWGWHRHDTDGLFEDAVVIPEAETDVLYCVISRTIGGATKRYIEKLERRDLKDGFVHSTSFFVDSGLSYSGTPADEFAGLDHLNGKIVAVYADGQVIFNGDPTSSSAASFTVTAGKIRLTANFTNVHIGLPIRFGEIELLSLDVEGSNIRDKKKRVQAVSLLVDRSARAFYAGPDATRLRKFEPSAWEGTADLNTGQLELNLSSAFDKEGRVLIRMQDPLPLTILGVVPSVELGG